MNTLNNVSKVGIWAALFILLYANTGCSIIHKIDDECDVDEDCANFGAEVECRKNLCVGAEEVDGDRGSSGDSNTRPVVGMDLLGGPCTRLDGMDDPTNEIPDDAIIIGSILPVTGELSVAGEYFDHVTIFANEEINRAGGIMGRDIIKIGCDSGTSPTQAREAAEHLRDLGVQAVLGPFSSEIVMSVYSDVLRDAGMMVVSAGANAPIIATASGDGLIWSTSLPAAREAAATAAYLLSSSWERVAVIHRSDTWGDSMFNAFYEVYCSAGGIDCTDDDTFLVRSYDTADLTTSMSAVVTDLAAWEPDITVSFSYIDDALTFFNIVGMTGAPLRRFAWNSGLVSELVFSLLPQEYHSILCQTMATSQQMPEGIVYGSFLTRYRARWNGEDPVPYTVNFYDAFYMLAYAYAAASSEENPNPTGAEIAAAMQRLSAGAEINAGAEDWNIGVTALRAADDSTIDYVGASGDVDLSAGTGSVICPVEAIRYNVGNQSLESLGLIYSGTNEFSAPDYTGVVDTICGDNI